MRIIGLEKDAQVKSIKYKLKSIDKSSLLFKNILNTVKPRFSGPRFSGPPKIRFSGPPTKPLNKRLTIEINTKESKTPS